jgi:hypothetical protein
MARPRGRADHSTVETHCVMCTNIIGPDRPHKSVTCSKACAIERKKYLRSHADLVSCRYCQRPSTPEERLSYQRWRRWEKKNTVETALAAPEPADDPIPPADEDESIGTLPQMEEE